MPDKHTIVVGQRKDLGVTMTLLEEIEKQLNDLPLEKQIEVLDFIAFLRQRTAVSPKSKRRSFKKHPAFGSWQNRHVDAVAYQQKLRAEWGGE
jgi:hypothetical protein